MLLESGSSYDGDGKEELSTARRKEEKVIEDEKLDLLFSAVEMRLLEIMRLLQQFENDALINAILHPENIIGLTFDKLESGDMFICGINSNSILDDLGWNAKYTEVDRRIEIDVPLTHDEKSMIIPMSDMRVQRLKMLIEMMTL